MDTTSIKHNLVNLIHKIHQKGWSPATSTNYSIKCDDRIWISRSGVDKSEFRLDDLIEIDSDGNILNHSNGQKTSAETLIHCFIYNNFPETNCILHSHGKYPVLLSQFNKDKISFNGYELQKGIAGVNTHDQILDLPIFENEQNMNRFCEVLSENIELLCNFAFIMRKHGLYTWGASLEAAKRHLETYEYLCEVDYFIKNR